jgi:CBS domain-containing protein
MPLRACTNTRPSFPDRLRRGDRHRARRGATSTSRFAGAWDTARRGRGASRLPCAPFAPRRSRAGFDGHLLDDMSGLGYPGSSGGWARFPLGIGAGRGPGPAFEGATTRRSPRRGVDSTCWPERGTIHSRVDDPGAVVPPPRNVLAEVWTISGRTSATSRDRRRRRLVGMVSDRDLRPPTPHGSQPLLRLTNSRARAGARRVIMSRAPITLTIEATRRCLVALDRHDRGLPSSSRRLVGIITVRDVLPPIVGSGRWPALLIEVRAWATLPHVAHRRAGGRRDRSVPPHPTEVRQPPARPGTVYARVQTTTSTRCTRRRVRGLRRCSAAVPRDVRRAADPGPSPSSAPPALRGRPGTTLANLIAGGSRPDRSGEPSATPTFSIGPASSP